MKFLYFLLVFSLFFNSCSDMNWEDSYSKRVVISLISQPETVMGVKVLKLEFFNRVPISETSSISEVYVSNIDLVQADMVGKKLDFYKGKKIFGGKDVVLTFKVLRNEEPRIWSLTNFEVVYK